MLQLNQLMDYDIDKNELSNTSGRKGRHVGPAGKGGATRDQEILKSMDGKSIQLLRDKNY